MTSKLSVDILSMIFEELEKEISTLYSCVFVNREWCQLGIPVLWKNPWKIFNEINWMNCDKYEDAEIRYKILFRNFLMLMTKEQKDFLKLNGIEFLLENSTTSLKKINKKSVNIVNSNVLSNENYKIGRYYKTTNSGKINFMVYHNIKDKVDYHEYLVEQEILKLLINNTSKLKCLIMCYKSHPIALYPNSHISLSQLNELHCNASIESTVFYGLSQLCRNIEKLIIEGYNDGNDGLITFIKQQINLKKVKFYEEDDEPYAQGKCSRIGYALTTKASSIKELDIGKTAITFPPSLLENFQDNLTIFKFGINYGTIEATLADELEYVLRNISIPNLQQLIIYNTCPPFDIIAKIIEKSKGDIRKISIGAYDSDKDDDILISSIAKNCPKLEYLMIWIGENLNELIELFKGCKQLRGLVLQFIWTIILKRKNVDELLELICDNASKQLRKFKMISDWEISRDALERFLDNWKKQKRNSLDLCITKSLIPNKGKNYYDDIISKHKETGVIRNFEYEEYIDFDACIDENFLEDWW
ncbi:11550_t:CDS:2 [Rhizophagus irregularis]|nr:11550_t:CDS:2 [Rhizophagus irregularis]